MIQVKCVACGKEYKLPDSAAGRKARCKACGEAMVIPDAPDDLFDDTPPAGDDLTALYGSSEDASPVIDQAVPADDPLAFNPETSFQRSTTTRTPSAPPMKLIIGAAAGFFGLILVVAVVLVVMSGGGESDQAENTNGLSFDANASSYSSGPGRSNSITPNSGDLGVTTLSGYGFGQDDQNNAGDSYIPYFDGTLLDDPESRMLRQWFFEAPEDVRARLNRVVHRGIAFYIPSDWSVEEKPVLELFSDKQVRDFYSHLYEGRADQNTLMSIKSGEEDTISMIVSQRPTGRDWPWVYRVTRISAEMMFGKDVMDKFEEGVPSFTGSDTAVQSGKAFVNRLKQEKTEQSVLFEIFDPQRFYVNFLQVSSAGYGTLLGGHRFVRIQGSPVQSDGTRKTAVIYIGFVGGLQVVMSAETDFNDFDKLNDLEWILRTSELITRVEAGESSSDDRFYKQWLGDAEFGLVFAEDKAPEQNLKVTRWYPSANGSLFLSETGSDSGNKSNPSGGLSDPGFVSPNNKPYGISVPEVLVVISNTRTAIRTTPHEDGTWLSMEVHKLAGLDRRHESAVSKDRTSVLVRGRRVAVPEGTEISDLVTDHFTGKRLLYPKRSGEPLRRVAYVFKDGPYLISVLGRYPASDEARLAMLDEAAKSVQPVGE